MIPMYVTGDYDRGSQVSWADTVKREILPH